MRNSNHKKIAMVALCFLAFAFSALGIEFWGKGDIFSVGKDRKSVFAYEYEYTAPETGDGTESNPYLITTESEFYYITQNLSAHYRLEADLVFDDYVPICTTDYTGDVLATEKTEPAHAFRGTFDGNGHRITYTVSTDFYTRANSGYIGLFGEIYGEAVVRDLTVEAHIGAEDLYYRGTYVGGLAGLVHSWTASKTEYHTATISNVTIAEESFVKGALYTGGLIGAKRGSVVENCTVYGTVYSNSGAGGIAGMQYPITSSSGGCGSSSDNGKNTVIQDTESYALVRGNVMVGGIVGNSGDKTDGYLINTYNRGTVQFAADSTSGASNNYEYWGDVYGYQAKDLTTTRIAMENSGSKTTLNIKGDFTDIDGFQAINGVTFEVDGVASETPAGSGETTVVATALFTATLGTSGTTYYGCVSNYSGAYFRITRADGRYVYVSVLDRTSGAFRHTIDVDLNRLTSYAPDELSDPASVEKDGTKLTVKTASAFEHFAWVSNGYIYDEPLGSDAAGANNNDATSIPKNIIHLTGETYDLTQSVGVWGSVAEGESDLLLNGGVGHPNFYGIGATTFAPFIGGVVGNGSTLNVYLNCPEGSFIGILGAVSSNAGGASATASTNTVSGLTVNGLIRGRNKVGIVGFHDNYAPSLLGYDRESTIELTDVTNNANVYGAFYVGGILGASNSSEESNGMRLVRVKVTNCRNNGAISGTYRVGGVIGALGTNVATAADMSNVSNYGSVTGSDYNDGLAYNLQNAESVGGVVGSVRDRINVNGAIANYGNVTLNGTGQYAGGIMGYTEFGFLMGENGSVRNEGQIRGYDSTGGLIGYASKYNEQCVYVPDGTVNANTVTGNQYVGGLVGRIQVDGAITVRGDFENTAEITGTHSVGGIFGYLYASNATTGSVTIQGNLTNSGRIVLEGLFDNVTASNAGGLIGYLSARTGITITGNLINRGEVTASTLYAGSTGNIMNTATDLNVGGLIGSLSCQGSVTVTLDGNSVNEAPVTGIGANVTYRNLVQRVGGVIGYVNTVSGTSYGKLLIKGSLESRGDVTGCYYVGGLFGTVSASLDAQAASLANAQGTVSAVAYAGGLAGNITGPSIETTGFTNHMNLSVSGHGYVGGLFGDVQYSVADGATTELLLDLGTTENLGSISAPNEYNEYSTAFNGYVGGIAGRIYSTQYDIHVKGTVTNSADLTVAGERIGGLFGSVNATKSLGGSPAQYEQKYLILEGTFRNDGDLSGVSRYANSNNMGGIVGRVDGSFRLTEGSSAENRGSLRSTGASYFGGIVGMVTYAYNDCTAVFDGNASNLGAIYAENGSYLGGILGGLSGGNNNLNYVGTLSFGGKGTLLNEGNLSGQSQMGGIFGGIIRNYNGSVSVVFEGKAVNTGAIEGKAGSIGGIGGNIALTNNTANLEQAGALTLGGIWENAGSVSGAGSYVGGNLGCANFTANVATLADAGTFTLSGTWTNTGSVTNVGSSYTGGNIGTLSATSPVNDMVAFVMEENTVLQNDASVTAVGYTGGNLGYFNWNAASTTAATPEALSFRGNWNNTGRIVGSGSNVGGNLGYLGWNAAAMTAGANAASLLGVWSNTGSVECTGGSVGGNIGVLYAKPGADDVLSFEIGAEIRNTGMLTATGSYAGGIFGRAYSDTKSARIKVSGRLENTAGVTKQSGNYTGGIFGGVGNNATVMMSITVEESGAIANGGKVAGFQYTGGMAGIFYGDLAANGVIENRGAVSGTSDTAGFAGYHAGAVTSEAATARILIYGSVTGTANNSVGLYTGRRAAALDEGSYGIFAAYVTLALGSDTAGISVTVDGTGYTTDESGIFRSASGEALTVALGDFALNQYTAALASGFEKTIDYTFGDVTAQFVTSGFSAKEYPLVQSVKLVAGYGVIGSTLYVEGVTAKPWQFQVTTVYYDGTAAEGSASVSLNLLDFIVPEPGIYLYHYSDSVELEAGVSVPVELTLEYVPQAVVDYLNAYKALQAVGAVPNDISTTATANFVSRYEKGVEALTAFRALAEPQTAEEQAFLSAYLKNTFEAGNTINLAAGQEELYAWTDAILDLSKGMDDGKNESGYLTGYEVLSCPTSVHYGNTTAGAYEVVLALFTLTNSGSGQLSSVGMSAEGTEAGYYRVSMPLTIWYSAYTDKISAVSFSRKFALYKGSLQVFALPNSPILTTAGFELFRELLEDVEVERETLELKLGLNTSYQTYITLPAAGGTYSTYLSVARGAFKSSVKDPTKPTSANADAWAQLLQISVDGGATWYDGAANYSSLFTWTQAGRYTVQLRLNRAAEGIDGLVNYDVSVNGIPLTAENGYQMQIELVVTAASAALKWAPLGGETTVNSVFAYTGAPLGFSAVFTSTNYIYDLRYRITDGSGNTVDGNTAIGLGTYTITAYAAYANGEPVPESVLILTNNTISMTILPRELSADELDAAGLDGQIYTGQAFRPDLSVAWNGLPLTAEIDYTAAYGENKNVGTGTVTLTFRGNFTGTAVLEFSILARDMSEEAFVSQPEDTVYTGERHLPETVVSWNGVELSAGTDYTLIYGENVKAGVGTVTVSFCGNYTGTVVREFEIEKADYLNIAHRELTGTYAPGKTLADFALDEFFYWSDPTLAVKAGNTAFEAYYNADPDNFNNFILHITLKIEKADPIVLPDYVVSDVIYVGGSLPAISLGEGSTPGTIVWDEYELTAGTHAYGWTFTPDDAGYRSVSGTVDFTVTVAIVTSIEVTLESNQFVYGVSFDDLRKLLTVTAHYEDGTSKQIEPVFCVLTGSLNAGTQQITVEYGDQSDSFEIEISKAEPAVYPEYERPETIYTSGSLPALSLGEGSTPGTIDWNAYVLSEGTYDFTWTFTPDDALNYQSSTGTVSFTITAVKLVSVEAQLRDPQAVFYYGAASADLRGALAVTAHYNDGSSHQVEDFMFEVDSLLSPLPVGTHTCKVAFNDVQTEISVQILARDISGEAVISQAEDAVYTGEQIVPEVTVTWNGNSLELGTDYTVSYVENLKPGTAVYTVNFCGNFAGTVQKSFLIAARDISGEAAVSAISWATYTGDAILPVPSVTWEGGQLTAGVDYVLSYGENLNAGEGSVTVTFCGCFAGRLQRTFRIARAAAVGMEAGIPDQSWTSGAVCPAFEVTFGGSVLLNEIDYTVQYFDNEAPGTAYAVVTFTRNYIGTLVVPFRLIGSEEAAVALAEEAAEEPVQRPLTQQASNAELPSCVLPETPSAGREEEQEDNEQ